MTVPPGLSHAEKETSCSPTVSDRQPSRARSAGRPHARVPEGWRAFVVGGYDGEDVEVVVFCPDCAEREAGSA